MPNPGPADTLDCLDAEASGLRRGVDEATVLWAGAAPGTAGLYQVNIQLPQQIPRTQFIPPIGVDWLGAGISNGGCIVPVR